MLDEIVYKTGIVRQDAELNVLVLDPENLQFQCLGSGVGEEMVKGLEELVATCEHRGLRKPLKARTLRQQTFICFSRSPRAHGQARSTERQTANA